MSVNLKKGGRLSLTKERPGLNRVIVGLGWDPVKKRGLFGFKEAKIDCDASAILCRNGKYSIKSDLIYFNRLHHKSGAVNHLGDNLTGEGDGDDERIIVDLKDLPSDVDRVIFTVNIFRGKQRGQSFDKIENAFIRVIDDRDDTELVHYNLTENFKGMLWKVFNNILVPIDKSSMEIRYDLLCDSKSFINCSKSFINCSNF